MVSPRVLLTCVELPIWHTSQPSLLSNSESRRESTLRWGPCTFSLIRASMRRSKASTPLVDERPDLKANNAVHLVSCAPISQQPKQRRSADESWNLDLYFFVLVIFFMLIPANNPLFLWQRIQNISFPGIPHLKFLYSWMVNSWSKQIRSTPASKQVHSVSSWTKDYRMSALITWLMPHRRSNHCFDPTPGLAVQFATLRIEPRELIPPINIKEQPWINVEEW